MDAAELEGRRKFVRLIVIVIAFLGVMGLLYDLFGQRWFAERDAQAVVALHDADADGEGEDDYYAQFEVPDDLQW